MRSNFQDPQWGIHKNHDWYQAFGLLFCDQRTYVVAKKQKTKTKGIYLFSIL